MLLLPLLSVNVLSSLARSGRSSASSHTPNFVGSLHSHFVFSLPLLSLTVVFTFPDIGGSNLPSCNCIARYTLTLGCDSSSFIRLSSSTSRYKSLDSSSFGVTISLFSFTFTPSFVNSFTTASISFSDISARNLP